MDLGVFWCVLVGFWWFLAGSSWILVSSGAFRWLLVRSDGSWLGPGVSWLGPGVSWLGPGVSWLGPGWVLVVLVGSVAPCGRCPNAAVPAVFAQPIVSKAKPELLRTHFIPTMEKLKKRAGKVVSEEEQLRMEAKAEAEDAELLIREGRGWGGIAGAVGTSLGLVAGMGMSQGLVVP